MDSSLQTKQSNSAMLSGLFQFSAGLLTARNKTQKKLGDSPLGHFQEKSLSAVLGLSFPIQKSENTDSDWLQLKRLQPTLAPMPSEFLCHWLDEHTLNNPRVTPAFREMQTWQVTRAEANRLIRDGVLIENDILPNDKIERPHYQLEPSTQDHFPDAISFNERHDSDGNKDAADRVSTDASGKRLSLGERLSLTISKQASMVTHANPSNANPSNEQNDTSRLALSVDDHPDADFDNPDEIISVLLRLENNPNVQAQLNHWLSEHWQAWAKKECPIRESIEWYNKLYKLHSKLHAGDSSDYELVWGIGLATYHRNGVKTIEMPVLESLVDIELDKKGTIKISPRDVAPSLNLEPFLEEGMDGVERSQSLLQAEFKVLLNNDETQWSPFESTLWEPLLEHLATNMTAQAVFVSRGDIEYQMNTTNGVSQNTALADLQIEASWVIYSRRRSTNLQKQELMAYADQINTDHHGAVVAPDCLLGFVDDIATRASHDPQPISRARLGFNEGVNDDKRQSLSPSTGQQNAKRRYYFPLAYNQEQAQIVDTLEQYAVVTVTGPPGTGKTHSIANVVAHYMALGRRVLVTARTAEAIAAVRSKLPDSLSSLVIASVTSDKEGAAQLENAIQLLSDEVVLLQVEQTRQDIAALEHDIEAAEREMDQCDAALADIAKRNLTKQVWLGKSVTAIELADILKEHQAHNSWFPDSPAALPNEQLSDTIRGLLDLIEKHEADLVYVDTPLPNANELPTARDLLNSHQRKAKEQQQPVEDWSQEPKMALDHPNSLDNARKLLNYFAEANVVVGQQEACLRAQFAACVVAVLDDSTAPIERALNQLQLACPAHVLREVEWDTGGVSHVELAEALRKRKSNLFFSNLSASLFNRRIYSVIQQARVNGQLPQSASDWQTLIDWLKLQKNWPKIEANWQHFSSQGLLPAFPNSTDNLLDELDKQVSQVTKIRKVAEKLCHRREPLENLFPYGLDVERALCELDFNRICRALRANLHASNTEATEADSAIQQLQHLSEQGTQPIFREAKGILANLGSATLEAGQLVEWRNELTRELDRVKSLQVHLISFSKIIQHLSKAGAPLWAQQIKTVYCTEPVGRPELAERKQALQQQLRGHWREAWHWAYSNEQLNAIIDLGNGNSLREKKDQLSSSKEQYFLDLIRQKTLLGLKDRITPEVQSALAEFTNGVRRLGSGTGKSAGRWRRVVQAAAKQSAPAAPVWIMPESKVIEQLPPDSGSFDLIILDEASQSDITSLGVLARGARLLIVGDEKQVSPSAVGVPVDRVNVLRAQFIGSFKDRDKLDENTSIFDFAMQRYPQSHLMLKEHFRCVHPIIEFSTRFYNGRLEPLRVPKASERLDPPLVDVFIEEAERVGKLNHSEANYIVEEIASITADEQNQHRDIAVISLIGGEQADYVYRLLMDHPNIGPVMMDKHRIICGDSRTMQGQERSIVFLSMVATDSTARAQRSQADKQRFNVALSRARDREYLVRSVSSKSLKSEDLKLQVIEHFKNPLPDGHTISNTPILDRCESGFERDVCERLLQAGYRVKPQVAAGHFRIDLVVEGHEDRRLAVELDGDRWHGPERWEDDMRRQATLERAGWIFWRVYGSQWYSAKDHYWEDLVSTLQGLGIEPIGADASKETLTEFRRIAATDIGLDKDAEAVSDIASDTLAEPVVLSELPELIDSDDTQTVSNIVADMSEELDDLAESMALDSTQTVSGLSAKNGFDDIDDFADSTYSDGTQSISGIMADMSGELDDFADSTYSDGTQSVSGIVASVSEELNSVDLDSTQADSGLATDTPEALNDLTSSMDSDDTQMMVSDTSVDSAEELDDTLDLSDSDSTQMFSDLCIEDTAIELENSKKSNDVADKETVEEFIKSKALNSPDVNLSD